MAARAYQRTGPLVLTFLVGVFLILTYYVNLGSQFDLAARDLINWGVVLLAFALGLGAVNLIQMHGHHISRRTAGQWPYSVLLLGSLIFWVVMGLGLGTTAPIFESAYKATILPLGATTYSMWCFWVISGSYRAFRIRSVQATLLLVAGVLVMLGNVPIGEMIWSHMPLLGRWIISVPGTGVNRGIFIGAALGAIALGLRTLLGRERGYMGGGT